MSIVTWPEAFLGVGIALAAAGAVWAFCWMLTRTEAAPARKSALETVMEHSTEPLWISGPALTDEQANQLSERITASIKRQQVRR